MTDVTLESLRNGSVLFFDKPLYWTSFDVVSKVRRVIRSATGERKIKVGHAGTLDPLATGLMIVCTGKATKQIQCYTGQDKEYEAIIKLGATTPSYDLETEIDRLFPYSHITREAIVDVLNKFVGEIIQIPPAYSAKYIEGRRAYEYARSGDMREPSPVTVVINNMQLLDFEKDMLKVLIDCSKGTYIRSLARDIGVALETGAHLTALKRIRIGAYSLEKAVSPECFEKYIDTLKRE